jgi:two-component system sensor histidine kinase CpxA
MLRGGSIFSKIFLGFWAVTFLSSASILAIALIVETMRDSGRSQSLAQERREAMARSLALYGQTALDLLENEGERAVERYSMIVSRTAGIRPYFFFQPEVPVPAGNVPREVWRIAADAAQSGESKHMSHRDVFVMAALQGGGRDGRFVVVGETQLDESGMLAPSARSARAASPPEAAVDACRGKREGEAASYQSPSGLVTGTCLRHGEDAILACAAPIPEGPEPGFQEAGGGGAVMDAPFLSWARLRAQLASSRHLGAAILAFPVLLFFSGFVCHRLARHLTSPLCGLREAARRMTNGELSIRVSRDIEGRDDEIAGLGRDFDLMAENLQNLIHLHRRLLRDVAHELRSPLARLNVALELAGRSRPEELPAALERIAKESRRLDSLIDGLLLLARLDNMSRPGKAEAVSLRGLMEEIVHDVAYENQGRNRRIASVLHGDAHVMGDGELLRQAVENVLRNALRHTAEGTAVEVRLDPQAYPADARARIQVRDHGPGVPPHNLPHIFKAFYRADDSRQPGLGGAGLGLSIAESAVRLHGGLISASNHPEGGLLVEILLPAASPAVH